MAKWRADRAAKALALSGLAAMFCSALLLLAPCAPGALPGGHSVARAQEGAPAELERSPSRRPRVKIEIIGIKGRLLKNVKGYLRLLEKSKDPRFSRQWLKFLHQEAPADIRKALEPFGYFTPSIESELKELGDGRWKAIYRIDPGPRVQVRQVDVRLLGEGASDAELERAARDFPLKPGDPLDQELYERGKRAIIKLALSKGYVDVEPKVKKVLVDPERQSAVIRLHIDTGPRYFLGEIRLHQDLADQEAIDQGLIRRYLKGIEPGQPFSDRLLLDLQQALSNTGYFSLVDVTPAFDEADEGHRVPVDIRLEPSNRHTLSFGVGYDTEIELNGSFHWHNARVNRLGHTSDLWARLSMKQNTIKGAYWIPGEDPRTDRFGMISTLEQEDSADTERNTVNVEGGYHFLWDEWSSKLFTELKLERFRSDGDSWTYTKMLSLGGQLEKSTIPKGPFPQRGWYLYSETRASAGLFSDTAYIRQHMRGKLLLPAGSQGRLLVRGRLGLAAVSRFSRYPDSLRFFAGGGESVRGYRWKRLGPEDGDGNVVGGRNVISAGCEYDYRFLEHWVGAIFVDAGNAFNGSLDKIYVGTGLGVRWLSPVGTVRVDFGWPVNEDHRGMKLSSVKFYFGFEINL